MLKLSMISAWIMQTLLQTSWKCFYGSTLRDFSLLVLLRCYCIQQSSASNKWLNYSVKRFCWHSLHYSLRMFALSLSNVCNGVENFMPNWRFFSHSTQTSKWKELRVNALECVFSNEACGTLRFKTAVHSLNLVLGKSRCFAKCW